MTPQPEKHPTTAVGVAHRIATATGWFGIEPYGPNRVRITIDLAKGNVIADALEAWLNQPKPEGTA